MPVVFSEDRAGCRRADGFFVRNMATFDAVLHEVKCVPSKNTMSVGEQMFIKKLGFMCRLISYIYTTGGLFQQLFVQANNCGIPSGPGNLPLIIDHFIFI